MDQYMDSYGDNITIGCLGKIAYYRLKSFFPCMCVRGGRCVCLSLSVYKHLSMNGSIECVCTNLSMCYERG